MSLHKHSKVTFNGKVYYKRNAKNGKCDLFSIQNKLIYVGVREELL